MLSKNDYPSSCPTTEIQNEGYAVQLHFSFENSSLTSKKYPYSVKDIECLKGII